MGCWLMAHWHAAGCGAKRIGFSGPGCKIHHLCCFLKSSQLKQKPIFYLCGKKRFQCSAHCNWTDLERLALSSHRAALIAFSKKQIINSSNDFTLCLLWIFISPQQIMAAVLCAPVPRNQFTLIDSNTLCTRWKLHHQNMFGMIELDFCVNHLVKMHFSLPSCFYYTP